MFVTAIERAGEFTRPILTIVRYFGSTDVYPGAASLFFVNADGWALTCKHVAEQLVHTEQLLKKYEAFKAERSTLGGKHRRQAEHALENKYGYDRTKAVEVRNMFVNCVEGPLNVELKVHASLDLALLRFTGYTKLGCSAFPVFGKTEPAPKKWTSQ